MLAQWQNISLAFPDKKVLEAVSLTVYPKDRIALLGDNGAGKTSLFRILRGRLKPDSGTTSVAGETSVGYLEQSLAGIEDSEKTCMQSALEPFSELLTLESDVSTLNSRLASADAEEVPGLLEELGEAQQRFEASGGYEFRGRAESALSNLGLPEETWERPVSSLSAGQKVRLALAKVLLEDHDLLLLDEPTNHLDVAAREWLEEQLENMDSAFIVASHDRRFLDAVVEKVVHLDLGKTKVYPGNYSAFRRQRDEQLGSEWATYEKRRKTVKKLRKQAQTYAGWSQDKEKEKRGVYDKGFVGHRAAKLMKRSMHAQKRLEKTIEEMETGKPFEKDGVKVEFHGKTGRTLLVAENLSAGFAAESPLVEDVSFVLEGGDRLALLGPNGSGKTTLLRALLGEIEPISGGAKFSPSARVGYFDQENRRIDSKTPALRAVLDSGQPETLARTVMGRMRVRRDTVHKPFGALSAGERAKVLLTRLILGDYNLLVLDEPTNYLDIETQDVLLDALAGFPGGILLVSHDRHFVETLATESIGL